MFLTGRNEEQLRAASAEVVAAGGTAAWGAGDVAVVEDVQRLHREAAAFWGGEGPRVLVCNAGLGRFGLLEECSVDDFDTTMAVNVRGVFLWLRQLLPAMKAAGRGQIVVVSSVRGLKPGANCSLYSASKFALQGMVGSLREELRGSELKAGTVNPGAVATPWWLDSARGGKPKPATAEQLAGMLQPEDVAAAAMALVGQGGSSDIECIALDPR